VDALREDFPRQSSYAMCDGPDCLFIGKSGQKAPEQLLKDGALFLHGGRHPYERASHNHRFNTRDPDQLLDGFDFPGAVTISSALADKNPASTDTDFHQVWWPAGPWELLE